MARRVRSVQEQQGVASVRLDCARCGLSWSRPRLPGRVPRFCSDSCKQADWRDRVGHEEYNRRRREAETRRIRAARIRIFHAEFDSISASSPLPFGRALPLLRELAGVTAWDSTPVPRLYRTAALSWHPDKPGGDHKVFQLLQEAHRLAKLLDT
ncbi:J domain-containing protein [Streptomyces sp. NPDC006798]|uniref:J domain-containing protein n=1 Tax=Streptomyces sp. NPDC006798 TaxID=3155462 RepID=UPI00340E3FFC